MPDLTCSANIDTLLQAANFAAARTSQGVGTGDSPQFTAVNVGAASDTTLARVSAGVLSVEGNVIYAAGGTDIPVTDGGTGASTLAAHGVLIGNGASAVSVTGAGTAGQVLTSNGASADPTFQTVSGTGDVVGPGSAVAGNIAIFDGTTGKLIEDGGVAPIPAVSSSSGAGDAGKLTALNGSGVLDGSFFSGLGTGNVSNTGTPTAGQVAEWTNATTVQGVATTGSSNYVRATSPTLVTPILGTPTSGTLTNCTLPASGLTAGILAASVTFGENTSLILDAALSADGKYCGITEAGTAGTTLAFGDLVYLAVADSRWELTDADAEATAGPVKLGICVLAAAADGDPTVLLLWGKVRADTAFPTLTVGAPAYVSTTAGDIQVAQPSGADDVIRVVGYANTADELYFCPSRDYMTHT